MVVVVGGVGCWWRWLWCFFVVVVFMLFYSVES